MTADIQNQLKATGVARVIIRLNASAPTSKTALSAALGRNFINSETSVTTQLAASLMTSGHRPARAASNARMHIYPNLGLMLGTVDAAGLATLKADHANVSSISGAPAISLIRPVGAKAATSSLDSELTWGLKALGVEALWKEGLDGQGVLVGHLDTGLDGRHPAFKKGAVREFQKFDDLGFPVEPRPRATDSDDHGTHTAGTIAGRPVQGKHIGVAPAAELLSGMVIEGGEVVARVLAGMDWIVGSGARILNMSLGLRGYWDDFLDVTKLLRERNVLPVFAVGNEGPATSRSPGNYQEALSVGAYGLKGRRKIVADFSSSQRFSRPDDPVVPNLVGPGVDVISAKPGGGYQTMSGSSMATPHISGLAALLLQAKPGATVDELENAIIGSCEMPTSMATSRCGHGIPNAKRALKLLMS